MIYIFNFLEFQVEEKRVKSQEIEICKLFDWNVSMMTFYDFLEEFLSRGVLLLSDNVRIKENEVKENIDTFTSPPSNREKIEKLIWEEAYKEVKEETYIEKKAMDLDIEEVIKLTDLVERRCINLAQQISLLFLEDANIQMEIAYLLFTVARREAGIVDNNQLQEILGVGIRDSKQFWYFVESLSREIPNEAMNIKFDLVYRVYDKNGVEMIPPQLSAKIFADRDAMARMIMSNPEYREKMIKLGRINPKLVSPPPPPPPFLFRDTIPEKRSIKIGDSSEGTIHQSPVFLDQRKKPKIEEIEEFRAENLHRRRPSLTNLRGKDYPVSKKQRYSHNSNNNSFSKKVPILDLSKVTQPKRCCVKVQKSQYIEEEKKIKTPVNYNTENKKEEEKKTKIKDIYERSKKLRGGNIDRRNRSNLKDIKEKDINSNVTSVLNRVIVILVLLFAIIIYAF